MLTLAISCLFTAATFSSASDHPPVVRITADDTKITESCVIEIAPDAVIADANGDGVVHVAANDITIEWAPGSVLRGAPTAAPDDTHTGVGINIRGHTNVTIKGGEVRGFKVGIDAEHTDQLTIDGTRFNHNFRQRLKSTPEAEDSTDWLYPHHDDSKEWATKWGGAISIRHAAKVTVRNVRVRNGQNGILLHNVNDSAVYDNDVSFLSGWGIAMFRSNRNMISRNAADFCIRGHSEGVYNRGQDSAGLLAFEQCSNNTFIENSATHSGDGFFGFGGREALAEGKVPDGFDHKRKGCNDNIFIGNDFSYASAHGLEMTFSFGNIIMRNQFVEDGICGVWGGYSQETQIRHNTFIGCGALSYGLERGGVNIEHGANNEIIENEFIDNQCGVHLWWDPHGDFETKPWGRANYKGTVGNVVANNRFTLAEGATVRGSAAPMLHVRDARAATQETPITMFFGNTMNIANEQGRSILTDTGVLIGMSGTVPMYSEPAVSALGETRPVGKRKFGGREAIVMSEWGPWDFESAMVRCASMSNSGHRWQIFGQGSNWRAENLANGEVTRWAVAPSLAKPLELSISNPAGLLSYRYRISNGDGWETEIAGTVLGIWWDVQAFAWTDATDPRTNLEAWRALAKGDATLHAEAGSLNLRFNHGGPSVLKWANLSKETPLPKDRFGLIATASPTLQPGRYRITTTSDDGVRVMVNGQQTIENWTWHGPTKDHGEFVVETEGPVPLTVEYFEIDGFAVLELGIERLE